MPTEAVMEEQFKAARAKYDSSIAKATAAHHRLCNVIRRALPGAGPATMMAIQQADQQFQDDTTIAKELYQKELRTIMSHRLIVNRPGTA